jgi:hypothetical protein
MSLIKNDKVWFCFALAVLGFTVKVSLLLDRHSTT